MPARRPATRRVRQRCGENCSGADRRPLCCESQKPTPSRRATAPFGRRTSLPATVGATIPVDSAGSSQRLRADCAAALGTPGKTRPSRARHTTCCSAATFHRGQSPAGHHDDHSLSSATTARGPGDGRAHACTARASFGPALHSSRHDAHQAAWKARVTQKRKTREYAISSHPRRRRSSRAGRRSMDPKLRTRSGA